ncbi:MAG: hypothetical protein R3B52_02980 [Candidatus Paceibacterota bacterium]
MNKSHVAVGAVAIIVIATAIAYLQNFDAGKSPAKTYQKLAQSFKLNTKLVLMPVSLSTAKSAK